MSFYQMINTLLVGYFFSQTCPPFSHCTVVEKVDKSDLGRQLTRLSFHGSQKEQLSRTEFTSGRKGFREAILHLDLFRSSKMSRSQIMQRSLGIFLGQAQNLTISTQNFCDRHMTTKLTTKVTINFVFPVIKTYLLLF